MAVATGRWLGLGPHGEPALFLSASEHRRLLDAAQPSCRDAADEARVAQEKLREESRQRKAAMQKTAIKGPQQKTVRELQEEKRREAVKEMEEIRAKERKQIIEECKKQIFYQRDHAKTLNRALFFSEVLREREAQVQFNKYLEELEVKKEARWAEKVKQNALEHKKDKLEAKNKEREKKLEFRKKIQEQIDEKMQQSETEKEMVLHMEQEELDIIRKEVEEDEQRKKAEEHAKKMKFKTEVETNLKVVKEHEEKMKKADLLEDKLIKIYRNFKDKVDRTRHRREIEIRNALVQRSDDMAAVLVAIADEKKVKEDELIRKAIAIKEAEYAEREQRGHRYRQALEEERRRAHQEHLQLEDVRREQEEQQLRLAMLHRLKQDEVNLQMDAEQEKLRRRRMVENFQSYQQQEELQKELSRLEKEEDTAAVKRAAEAWREEDLRFLRYAEEVIADSRRVGRPLQPLTRIVDRYKRKCGMVCTTKIEPLQQSKIAIGIKSRPLCPKDCCSTDRST